MTRENTITAATHLQHAAADPTHSVWLAANAGTGKTYVLIQRLIRLLLADPELPPRKILALTYSRAAAKEMTSRLTQKVSGWAALNASEFIEELIHILGRAPTEKEVTHARDMPHRIAAESINAMTLHKFCQTLLRRFPLEAGLSPQFVLWEEIAAEEQLQIAQNASLQELANPEHHQHWALDFLATYAGQGKVHSALKEYLKQRDKLVPFTQDDTFDNRLRSALNIAPTASRETLLNQFNNVPKIADDSIALLRAQAPHFASAGKRPHQHFWNFAEAFFNVEKQNVPPQIRGRAWQNIWLKADGDARNITWALGKTAEKIGEAIIADFAKIQADLIEAESQKSALKTYLATDAFMALGGVVEAAYAAQKHAAAALDFDDLIQLAHKLLEKSELKDWIRYRLDGGVQHILLDETQDTNQKQWEIVAGLMADFFAGDGQTEAQNHAPRTLFAVGDFKQSIYRFQGAESAVFSAMQSTLKQAKSIGYSVLEEAQMVTSFRSVTCVLRAVDQVFNQAGYDDRAAASGQNITHQTARRGEPGSVLLWPPLATESVPEAAPWTRPELRAQKGGAKAALGAKIAAEIRDIISGNFDELALTKYDDAGALTKCVATLDDILLLVRSRSALPDLTAALAQNGFRYTTIDKPENNLHHPIVQDILALLSLLLQPRDDVALATVLRSPLYGWSNAQLRELFLARAEGQPLFDVLPKKMQASFDALRQKGQQQPLKTLQTLAHDVNMIGKLAANVGYDDFALAESQAVFNGFLAAAGGHAHLVDFIVAVKAHGLAILRPESVGQNTLRILTVHGAKGLEAPIVFMVDGQKNFYQSGPEPDVLAWDEDLCLFRLSGAHKTALQTRLDATEHARILQDELRLLYVAMTRAAQRLYICAAGGKYTTAEKLRDSYQETGFPNNWWGMVANAAAVNGWAQTEDGGYALREAMPSSLPKRVMKEASPAMKSAAPDWLFTKIDVPAPAASAEDSPEQKAAKARGDMLHQALAAYCDYGKKTALALLETPEDMALINGIFEVHPWLLGSTSVSGRCEAPFVSNGQKRMIDRLLVDNTKKEITIVDYKSDAIVPDAIPEDYAAQLLGYKAIMSQLYPDHTITAGILWLMAGTWQPLDA